MNNVPIIYAVDILLYVGTLTNWQAGAGRLYRIHFVICENYRQPVTGYKRSVQLKLIQIEVTTLWTRMEVCSQSCLVGNWVNSPVFMPGKFCEMYMCASTNMNQTKSCSMNIAHYIRRHITWDVKIKGFHKRWLLIILLACDNGWCIITDDVLIHAGTIRTRKVAKWKVGFSSQLNHVYGTLY